MDRVFPASKNIRSRRIISVSVAALLAIAAGKAEKGLDFPSNGDTRTDIRFRFSGPDLQPMYPATYLWRVKLRRQSGYYTTFFWGPDGPFTGASYYGAHPYPDGEPKPGSRDHKWEMSIDGRDVVEDANGHSTQLGYDVWRTQALRVFDDGSRKVHEFYWDLPDTTKVIKVQLDRNYGQSAPLNPALTFGDAPWSLGNERLSGILRGIQLYSAALPPRDIVAESSVPGSTTTGASGLWYLNLDPQPDDIADKSGRGHHPAWSGSGRATAWSSEPIGISAPRASARADKGPVFRYTTALGRAPESDRRCPIFILAVPAR